MSEVVAQKIEAGFACANAHVSQELFVPTLLGHMAASPIMADGSMALTAIIDRARSFAFECRS